MLILKGDFESRKLLTINISDGTVIIGDGVFFNQGVSLNCRLSIIIGKNTIVGENVKIYDHNHRFREKKLIKKQGFKLKEVNIGENVWIGTNTVILSGVSVGANSVISAGSIVKRDVPADTIYVDGKFKKIQRAI
jgi:acetyltransferase-like isoleucine patch superfamily enzyme